MPTPIILSTKEGDIKVVMEWKEEKSAEMHLRR
jgi:hypothetical protein